MFVLKNAVSGSDSIVMLITHGKWRGVSFVLTEYNLLWVQTSVDVSIIRWRMCSAHNCSVYAVSVCSVCGVWLKAKDSSILWLFFGTGIHGYQVGVTTTRLVSSVSGTHHKTFIQWSLKSTHSTTVLEENPGRMLGSQLKTERYRRICVLQH